MNWVTIIGLIAAVCTVIASLPQLIKSWKTRKTKDISLMTVIILETGIILWLIYGFLIKDIPIIFANAFGLVLVSSVLFLKIKHG